jgi:hypothetical protein
MCDPVLASYCTEEEGGEGEVDKFSVSPKKKMNAASQWPRCSYRPTYSSPIRHHDSVPR